jgi:hypothetical protein
VADLYDRVDVGTEVIVRRSPRANLAALPSKT